jgi:hypothetical protein
MEQYFIHSTFTRWSIEITGDPDPRKIYILKMLVKTAHAQLRSYQQTVLLWTLVYTPDIAGRYLDGELRIYHSP